MKNLNIIFLSLTILLGNICTSSANDSFISLNQDINIEGEYIKISDIFRGNVDNPDKIIAKAPLPGKKFTFNTDWAHNIALKNNIKWKPLNKESLISITRSSTKIDEEEIKLEILQSFFEIEKQDIEIEIYGGKTDFDIKKDTNYKILVENLKKYEAKNRFDCKVTIFSEGKEFASSNIAGKYYILQEVPVANENIAKNTIIKSEMIKNIKIRKNRIKPNEFTDIDDIIGKETTKSIKESKSFSIKDIRDPIIINKGNIISIIYKTKNMKLTAKGEAIEDGSKGQNIKVMNTTSKKVLHCRIISKDTVEIIK